MALLLFAVGFKAASALVGLALVAGGYLGFRYGSYVEKRAQALLAGAASLKAEVGKKL